MVASIHLTHYSYPSLHFDMMWVSSYQRSMINIKAGMKLSFQMWGQGQTTWLEELLNLGLLRSWNFRWRFCQPNGCSHPTVSYLFIFSSPEDVLLLQGGGVPRQPKTNLLQHWQQVSSHCKEFVLPWKWTKLHKCPTRVFGQLFVQQKTVMTVILLSWQSSSITSAVTQLPCQPYLK